MRLLLVADARSPIAANWISKLAETDHEIHLVSTFPSVPEIGLESYRELPLAFSPLAKKFKGLSRSRPVQSRNRSGYSWLIRFRYLIGPYSALYFGRHLRRIIRDLDPDLVHAMRIPFEGMMAASALPFRPPLMLSIWGNDLTLHAESSRTVSAFTRRTLARTSALHVDCRRDIKLAALWGLPQNCPTLVEPSGGGIQTSIFHPVAKPRKPIIINPRGWRPYVRNDSYFRAIPLVLKEFPEARFICPAMAEEGESHRWVERLGIRQNVDLLPKLSRVQLSREFKRAQIMVSVTSHDGTPNTLLEAMACGCFPIVGDMPSAREWIKPGENGFVVDSDSPKSLAEHIIRALRSEVLRQSAAEKNWRLIQQKAEHSAVMKRVVEFYERVVRIRRRH